MIAVEKKRGKWQWWEVLLCLYAYYLLMTCLIRMTGVGLWLLSLVGGTALFLGLARKGTAEPTGEPGENAPGLLLLLAGAFFFMVVLFRFWFFGLEDVRGLNLALFVLLLIRCIVALIRKEKLTNGFYCFYYLLSFTASVWMPLLLMAFWNLRKTLGLGQGFCLPDLLF